MRLKSQVKSFNPQSTVLAVFTLGLYLHNVSLFVSESVRQSVSPSACVQASVFAVRVPYFKMYLCWGVVRYYENLAYLNIQYGRQNGHIMFWIAYVLVFHSYYSTGIKFSYLSLLDFVIWIVCIFNMAAKKAKSCSIQHIFLSAVHSFYCMVLKF